MSTSDIAHRVAVEAAQARALLQIVADSLGDDAETAAIVIDGETNLTEAVAAAVARIAEIETHGVAIGMQVTALRDRKTRFDTASERLRNAIRAALETIGQQRLELPQATVSLRAVAARAEILDPGQIPAAYLRQPPPEVDKRAVLAALKAGATVNGAVLSNGGQTIAIRYS